uniref:Uncharacterized protein n=1 Tax=Caenorhabditis japonica TaxID=281687 RepID=A0A8R1EMI3_CAEJA
MQAASSSVSSGGVLSPSKTQMAPPGQQQQQQQQQPVSYGAQMQYYYAAPMPAGAQPMPTFMPQNGNGQQYATQSYCQDENGQYVPIAPQQMMMPGQQYVYMAPPQQGSGQPVMQSGQPSYVYYPQHMGQMAPPPQMYYSTMPPPPANGSQMHSEQMQPSQPQQQRVGGAPRSAPLTSSTPLPTSLEYETVQRETARNNRNIQFRYHRPKY